MRSPSAVAEVERLRFENEHRFMCSCPKRELREEYATIFCADCGRPIVRRASSTRTAKQGVQK